MVNKKLPKEQKNIKAKIGIIAALLATCGGGGGVGIGYAIWHNSSKPTPPPEPVINEIEIRGLKQVNGVNGISNTDAAVYYAIDNNGSLITSNLVWSIVKAPTGVNISNDTGVLALTNEAVSGDMEIKCVYNDSLEDSFDVFINIVMQDEYTLKSEASVLDWNKNNPVSTTLTMELNGSPIDDPSNIEFRISDDSPGKDYVKLVDDTLVYVGKDSGGVRKPVYDTSMIDVMATYQGHTAKTSLILDDFQPTNVLVPNDPEWANLFLVDDGILESTSVIKTDWLQKQSQYNTIDLSSFDAIDQYAFANCASLQSGSKYIAITFENVSSEDFSIGGWAFEECTQINSIVFPKSGSLSIDSYAFDGCSNLMTVTSPEDSEIIDLYSISTNAFANCTSLTKVDFSSMRFTIPADIGNNAFENCAKLEEILLPSGDITFKQNAFKNCTNLQLLKPTDDTKISGIGNDAFYGCAHLDVAGIIRLSEKIEESKLSFYHNDDIGAAIVSNGEWINGAGLVAGVLGTSIQKTNLFLRSSAFEGCASLVQIDLQNETYSSPVGSDAFKDCVNLMEIHLPSVATGFGISAFENCEKLNTLYWHSPTTPSIGYNTFTNCALFGNVFTIGNQETAWKQQEYIGPLMNWKFNEI